MVDLFFEIFFLIKYFLRRIPSNLSKSILAQPHSVQKKRKAPNSTDPFKDTRKSLRRVPYFQSIWTPRCCMAGDVMVRIVVRAIYRVLLYFLVVAFIFIFIFFLMALGSLRTPFVWCPFQFTPISHSLCRSVK